MENIEFIIVDPALLPPPEKSPEQVEAEALKYYDGLVQSRLDDGAKSFGYGDPNKPEVSPMLHAISYADEPAVVKFQAEGRVLRAWRSLTWAGAVVILDAVKAGNRPVPTKDELYAELPPVPTEADVLAEIDKLQA